jgi:hypothetical protein
VGANANDFYKDINTFLFNSQDDHSVHGYSSVHCLSPDGGSSP